MRQVLGTLPQYPSVTAACEAVARREGVGEDAIVCGSNVNLDTYHHWIGMHPIHSSWQLLQDLSAGPSTGTIERGKWMRWLDSTVGGRDRT
ncbi:hypothetical protein [Mycolicibacterium vanbaalenii]|uniref:hypothetical protein n=1 Tax=Mycolicibacterium vanbaalenii TaxID=110539 RepID=UPI0013018042|nr:hypothetical protein [Mycolicibacterium vanbaalenii]MCV7129416.1 hypothetical protein [Mycolicibacterium vanbaalenii PYR-1]